jgi:uncharacterized protein
MIFACICILVLIIFGDMMTEKLVFRSKALDAEYVYQFSQPFEELNIPTEKDILINVVRFKVPNPKGAILYFHGNRDNLSRWGEIAAAYTNYGYDVFVVDYRGYGKSNGIPNEKNTHADAESLYKYLSANYKYDQWVLCGRSLGSGVATILASKVQPSKLILETPYFSMERLVGEFYFPYRWFKSKPIVFRSYEFIGLYRGKTLMLHGTADALIDVSHARDLYQKSNKENTKLVIIMNGTHNNLGSFKEYEEGVRDFLE